MPREPEVRFVVLPGLTEEGIAEARERLHELAGLLGRISATACHKLGIIFDMDDPEVAREVVRITFEALFFSPSTGSRSCERKNALLD